MKARQIKSLELLIIQRLNDPLSVNPKTQSAFEYVLNHFSDEDFLHNLNHKEILTLIYQRNFYKFKSVKALCLRLSLDNKTLLSYRKQYVTLFAKHFLDLSCASENDLPRLYAELRKPRSTGKQKI